MKRLVLTCFLITNFLASSDSFAAPAVENLPADDVRLSVLSHHWAWRHYFMVYTKTGEEFEAGTMYRGITLASEIPKDFLAKYNTARVFLAFARQNQFNISEVSSSDMVFTVTKGTVPPEFTLSAVLGKNRIRVVATNSSYQPLELGDFKVVLPLLEIDTSKTNASNLLEFYNGVFAHAHAEGRGLTIDASRTPETIFDFAE